MIPKLFKDLIKRCNDAIVNCEESIRLAELCAKGSSADKSCADFIEHAKVCASSCEECIKACDAMKAAFAYQGHLEHQEALDSCVKALGEHIRIITNSANNCSVDNNCRTSCLETKQSCNDAIEALDECIESCEKHEVFYLHIKK